MPTGYIHGSNLLIFVGGKAIGHCSTCEITHNTESKERAVKPPAKQAGGNTGKWTEKSVTKLSESLSAEGFCFYDETECGYNELLALWQKAEPVEVKYNHRRGQHTLSWRQVRYHKPCADTSGRRRRLLQGIPRIDGRDQELPRLSADVQTVIKQQLNDV